MKKIIILGGGPAGLTAAYELLKDTENEYDVTILEESGVLGGISQTVRYHGNHGHRRSPILLQGRHRYAVVGGSDAHSGGAVL